MTAALSYPLALVAISVLVFVLERLFAARPDQRVLRQHLADDVLHLVFNGHFLGLIGYGIAREWLLPALEQFAAFAAVSQRLGAEAASEWPLWLQIPVALLAIDLLQYCVHYLLHRSPLLWTTHQCHHSVRDGEMDWIVAFRFQWTEFVVYRSLLYLPLAFFGFGQQAVFVHAVFGTLIGHLNHANLSWDYGPLRYVLNNPRMHIWHHDYDTRGTDCGNFGIIFSCWDYIFGTARVPDGTPRKLGFEGMDTYPRSFAEQELWPLVPPAAATSSTARFTITAVVLGIIALGVWLFTYAG